MEPADYLGSLRRDGKRIAAAAEGALDCAVPSCPEWTVADLAWHVGTVYSFWRQIASAAIPGPEAYVEPERPADEELVAWFRGGVDEIARVLEALDAATPAWTWAPQKNVGFIQRRMAQETAMHCWDALAAVGRTEPIEPSLAVDGVDEFLDVCLSGRPTHLEGRPETIHLHATDADGEWVVRAGDGTCRVGRVHGKGDAAVRATASDLLLLLWRRRSPDQLEVHGDRAALARFLARSDLG
ncbi:MAG: maleylpyruvate isomerase family mycothiol-dependent enzyme [Egibacteraceae bacterium]